MSLSANNGNITGSIELVHLCRPGGNKGCCICCGLFNLSDISRENLESFLKSADERLNASFERMATGSWLNGMRLRDESTYVCPYQGFAEGDTVPVCRAHPAVWGAEGRGRSLYGEKLCREYWCPAYYLMNDEMKQFLVRYTRDWYEYSVAIADPEFFMETARKIMAGSREIPHGTFRDETITESLGAALRLHALRLNAIEGQVFHYAVSEYRHYRKDPAPVSGSL